MNSLLRTVTPRFSKAASISPSKHLGVDTMPWPKMHIEPWLQDAARQEPDHQLVVTDHQRVAGVRGRLRSARPPQRRSEA
jgi:hypothetical protein